MIFNSKELDYLSKNLRVLQVATVVNSDPATNSYNLQTADGKLLEGKPAACAGGGYLRGTGSVDMFQEGAEVLYYQAAKTGIVLSAVPKPGRNPAGSPPATYSNIRARKERSKVGPRVVYRGGNPTDLLPGDYMRYTAEGGILALLRGAIAKLGAGPLANILFTKQDDLCRLTSRNLEVFTDFMELRSENDEGESNLTLHASPNFFETLGADSPGEEIGEHSPDEEKLRYRIKPYDRAGKWRIHGYSGWLGDNLHLFISRRGSANKRTDKEPPDGLTEVIVSHDGAVRVRSCRELMLEKVNFIPVPKKIRESFHNEKGDSEKNGYQKTPHEVYEWSESDPEGRHMQLPEYHNHVVDHEEKRHFRDHSKDWNTISEKGSESKAFAPPPTAQDIYEGQEEQEFEKTYSIIHQRSDGSIYIEDTDGSSINMNKGNISLSAKQDVRIQAGRDLLMTAGRETTLRSTEDVDIVSHKQNVRVKANEALRLIGEDSACLESVKKQATVLSRKGDVQIRSERENIILKADLKDLKTVVTEGRIQLRSKKDISLVSDEGQLDLYAKSKIQVLCPGNILIAVGQEGPTPKMKGELRDIGDKTNVSKSEDMGNSAGVTSIPENSYLFLSGPEAILNGDATVDVRSKNTRVIAPGTHLTVRKDGYTLSSKGRGVIRREGDRNIHERDSDQRDAPTAGDQLGGTVNDKNGDYIWTTGASHGTLSVTDPSPVPIDSVKADVNKEELADARFRFKIDKENNDYEVYNYGWQHEGGKITMTKGLVDWSSKIPSSEQDVPDIGALRPVQGEDQLLTPDPEIEQTAPYSKYKKFKDGDYDFDTQVTPGTFEETKEFRIPGGGSSSTTTVTAGSSGSDSEGRITKIPESAMGESFDGSLDRSEQEDVVNTILK